MGLEEGRQEKAHSAQHAHNHEHPQKQPVHHHGHVFPVLHDLWADRGGSHRRGPGSPLLPELGPHYLAGTAPGRRACVLYSVCYQFSFFLFTV